MISRFALTHKLNPLLAGALGSAMVVTCTAVLLCATSASAQEDAGAQTAAQSQTQHSTDGEIQDNDGQPQDADATHAPDQVAVPDDIDWSLLNSDVAALPGKTPKNREPAVGLSRAHADWKRSDHGDGSSAVSVRQSIIPFWDAKIGADMTVASPPPTTSQEVLSRRLEGTDPYSQSSGSAWAGLTAPGVGTIWDKTTIEARIDPSQDQSTFGTAISKSLPLGSDQYSLTMQSGASLIQQGNTPLAGIAGYANRNVAIDNSARLNVLGTGTSLIAGQTLSTADDNRWLSHVGAEQKLLGGVSVTGSISETAEGYAERSLKAGYKYSW